MDDNIDSQELQEVAEEVLSELAASIPPSMGAPVIGGTDPVASYVRIVGPAEDPGVIVEADRGAAADLSSRLLGLTPEEVTQADLEDALAELTNLVAGSIKLLISEETRLDVPAPIPPGIRALAVAEVAQSYGLLRVAMVADAASGAAAA